MAFNEMLQPKKSVALIFVAQLFHFEQNSSFVGCIHQKYIPKSFASIWYYPVVFKSLTCDGEFNLIHAFCWYETECFRYIPNLPQWGSTKQEVNNSQMLSVFVSLMQYSLEECIFSATRRCCLKRYLWQKNRDRYALFLPIRSAHIHPIKV